MDNDLEELILAKVSECAAEYCTRHDIDFSKMKVVRIEKSAEVWGDNVLSGEFQATTDSIEEPLR